MELLTIYSQSLKECEREGHSLGLSKATQFIKAVKAARQPELSQSQTFSLLWVKLVINNSVLIRNPSPQCSSQSKGELGGGGMTQASRRLSDRPGELRGGTT